MRRAMFEAAALLAVSVVSCLSLAAPASGQDALFLPFGQGCSYAGQSLRIGHAGLPRIGSSFRITYSGPNAAQPVPAPRQLEIQPHLALGWTPSLPMLVPAALLPLQPRGCHMLITVDFVVPCPRQLSAWPVSVFADSVLLTVPPHPPLIGVQFFAQWWTSVHDSRSRALHAALTSDAALLAIGG